MAPLLDGVLRSQVGGLVPPLGAGHDGQVLLLGDLAGRDHLAAARRVHRHGLLHEHVLAGLDGRLEVHRPEVRRRRDEDQLDVRCEQLLVGVAAEEALGGRNVVLFARPLGPVLEPVGRRDHLQLGADDLGGFVAVLQGAGAAAAAADAGPRGTSRGADAANITFLAASTVAIPAAEVFTNSRRETFN